jgi:hypothetical protein
MAVRPAEQVSADNPGVRLDRFTVKKLRQRKLTTIAHVADLSYGAVARALNEEHITEHTFQRLCRYLDKKRG